VGLDTLLRGQQQRIRIPAWIVKVNHGIACFTKLKYSN
jgi:hypothetical protein